MWHNSIHCEFSTQTHNITSLALLFRSTLLRSYHTSSFSIPLLAHLTVLYFLMTRLSARNAHPWPVADTKLNGSSRDDNRPAGAHSHSHQFISALIILCSIRIYIYRHIPGLLNQLREWKQTKKTKKRDSRIWSHFLRRHSHSVPDHRIIDSSRVHTPHTQAVCN